jgi:hypothetical protein
MPPDQDPHHHDATARKRFSPYPPLVVSVYASFLSFMLTRNPLDNRELTLVLASALAALALGTSLILIRRVSALSLTPHIQSTAALTASTVWMFINLCLIIFLIASAFMLG